MQKTTRPYTVADLSRLFDVSRGTIYNWINAGVLKTLTASPATFSPDEVERFYNCEFSGTKRAQMRNRKPVGTPDRVGDILTRLQQQDERLDAIVEKLEAVVALLETSAGANVKKGTITDIQPKAKRARKVGRSGWSIPDDNWNVPDWDIEQGKETRDE